MIDYLIENADFIKGMIYGAVLFFVIEVCIYIGVYYGNAIYRREKGFREFKHTPLPPVFDKEIKKQEINDRLRKASKMMHDSKMTKEQMMQNIDKMMGK